MVELRVTRRCLLEDLGENELELSIEELAEKHDVVRSFREKRAQHPGGQETIQNITSRIVAHSLHSGAHRGATWHDKKAGVVWLLAARLHRSGKPDDAYPYFVSLDATARLLPTRDDYEALVRFQAISFARALLEDVPPLLDGARRAPGAIQEGTIGGRVKVRCVYEEGDSPMCTVAVSQRLAPGEMQVPPGWQIAIAAAFLSSGTSAEDLSFAGDLAGKPLNDDEVAYCDFVEDT